VTGLIRVSPVADHGGLITMEARPSHAPTRCNATEMLLHSGRGMPGAADDARSLEPVVRRPPEVKEFVAERVELGLLQVGRRLETLLHVLGPYRSADHDLGTAYGAAHDALGDLAATYTWVTLGARPAPPARPGRRRRPWGGRS
jgi:hypothetical protein